jgi:hypothetical protein
VTEQEYQPEPVQPVIRLQGFTYDNCQQLLPKLGAAIPAAGGWVLDWMPHSAHTLGLCLELQMAELPDVYGALLGSGLHLTRESHRALTERCNCNLHLRDSHDTSSYLLICLELHCPPDPTELLSHRGLFPPCEPTQ